MAWSGVQSEGNGGECIWCVVDKQQSHDNYDDHPLTGSQIIHSVCNISYISHSLNTGTTANVASINILATSIFSANMCRR
jgi:hypothetical protein